MRHLLNLANPLASPVDDQPTVVMACERRVRVAGAVDAFSARELESVLLPLASSRSDLVVDLSEVDVLTSGGLSALQRCADRAAELGHRLRLSAPEATLVQRVLTLARVPHQVVRA